MTLSNASLNCRIDWRPSRLLQGALLTLGFLAFVSVWLSALAWPFAFGFGALALVWSACEARRQAMQPACSLVWQATAGQASVNFASHRESWHSPKVTIRGSIVCFTGVDPSGHTRRLLWWPDTLGAGDRRRLTLSASVPAVEKMAPAAR